VIDENHTVIEFNAPTVHQQELPITSLAHMNVYQLTPKVDASLAT
jgi:hypothetical protein